MVRATKNRCRNMSQIGTTYVNGQEVLTAIDSCSSLTLIHHDLTVTTGNQTLLIQKEKPTSSIKMKLTIKMKVMLVRSEL